VKFQERFIGIYLGIRRLSSVEQPWTTGAQEIITHAAGMAYRFPPVCSTGHFSLSEIALQSFNVSARGGPAAHDLLVRVIEVSVHFGGIGIIERHSETHLFSLIQAQAPVEKS
jgi:hypothetical protein